MIPFLYSPILLQIPGGKLVTDGLNDISNSDSLLMNKLLVILLVLICFLFFCVIKYLIKKHKEELAAQLVSNAEKHAIDMGAQQLIVTGKDQTIKTLQTENEYHKEQNSLLKTKNEEMVRDNTEAFRQLTTKIGQFSEGQATLAGFLRENHTDMKLFITTIFNDK